MASASHLTGSSVARDRSSASFTIHEEDEHEDPVIGNTSFASKDNQTAVMAPPTAPTPLRSSLLGNLSTQLPSRVSSFKKQDHIACSEIVDAERQPVDSLLATLAQQEAVLLKQQEHLVKRENGNTTRLSKDQETSSEGSLPITPPSEPAEITSSPEDAGTTQGHDIGDPDEVLRLKQELADAKNKIARMDQELTQSRITKHTLDQVLGSPSEANFHLTEVSEQTISNLQGALNASTRPTRERRNSWGVIEEPHREMSGVVPAGPYGSGPGIWGNPQRANPQTEPVAVVNPQAFGPTMNWNVAPARPHQPPGMGQASFPVQPQPARPIPGSHVVGFGGNMRGMNDISQFPTNQNVRRAQSQMSRAGPPFGARPLGWGGYPAGYGHLESLGVQTNPYQSGHPFPGTSTGYQPHPIGTPLSPTAPEFTTTAGQVSPWPGQPATSAQTYVSTIEPLNYRRLLDRTVSCNWKYIVDKIVCNNDQQASIFLQQKLKIGSTEQKFEIIEAIVAQAYPLMVNRFGNFLVQRCFEHGTSQQIISIASAIRGNTLNLSMDSFGCHVVQKAFDCVPEEYKAIMVHELLRRIPETVVHRYACHVWQKLFELRWNDSPPQIMKYVNEALRGMWHEVALGETGSLVVQNIFENCLEEDKRPCINEVLASIDIVARGQFGNWCIQHICEHGLPADRSRAIDHVLRNAVDYSMDQFASKVMEKCLKIGGPEFLERYLDRVCEGRPDRPRIPLVDIASDQYGNYLIQYILTHANPQHRELVASHVRKHMVSLRGSKFGAKVGMLCCNPAYATRPGPGAGPYISRYSNSRFGGAYR